MFPERIETDRLVLERLSRDAVGILDLHRHLAADNDNAREELQYLPWGPFETPMGTREWILEAERRWDDGDRATYLLRAGENLEGPGDLVGVSYLDLFWERRAGEMVVWTRKPYWGRGLLVEFAMELHDLAFLDLDLEMMIAECFEEAEPLRERYETYVESFDGHYDGLLRNQVPADGEVKNVHRFTLSREEYLRTTGRLDEASEDAAQTPTPEAD
ncbi:MAG TPA: GNAT family protein [Natrialbaceae archaeon]|nr:GNAT family protein [Natrialbaceae archaeon]